MHLFQTFAVELLEASTPEAYLMSTNVVESFLKSFTSNISLRHWLHWWYDRRRNIFRTFTGHDHPRCKQAEVVYASWKNKDKTGLSLYQAAECDTRNSILSETELAEIMHTTKGKRCGPTLTEMSERRNHRNIAGVTRKGQDLVDFGVAPEPDETTKRSDFNNKSTDGSEFHKKQKRDNDLKMFENWVEASYDTSWIMKVNKSSIINAFKRSYLVCNSPTSRTSFIIEIGTIHSCTCSDFAKNGHRVLCKHILFIALHVLNGKDLKPLPIRFIEENDLRNLFDAATKDIKHQFLREQPTGKRKDFHSILVEHSCFTQPQIWKVQKSASGWQNVQTVVAERLLMLEPSVLLSKVL